MEAEGKISMGIKEWERKPPFYTDTKRKVWFCLISLALPHISITTPQAVCQDTWQSVPHSSQENLAHSRL